jgi:hypothetical protein
MTCAMTQGSLLMRLCPDKRILRAGRWPPTEAALELQPKGMRVSRRIVIKVCSVVSVGLIAYAALGPANWQLRPMLGWKTEHFLGFLIVTFIACVAWPRPLIVGLALMATAGLLEALQGLTPDRVPDLPTALCGAGGALLASVAAEVFIRARSPTPPEGSPSSILSASRKIGT